MLYLYALPLSNILPAPSETYVLRYFRSKLVDFYDQTCRVYTRPASALLFLRVTYGLVWFYIDADGKSLRNELDERLALNCCECQKAAVLNREASSDNRRRLSDPQRGPCSRLEASIQPESGEG